MVRRPENEYFLENEAEKRFLELSNGSKLRVLFLQAENPTDDTMNIVFYSGFISYIFLWRESIKVLRKNHNIYFIESREKEFSSFPDGEIIYDARTLGEDFILAFDTLELDLKRCVVTGSSIASVGILESMSKHDFRPFLSVHSSPQTTYKENNKPKNLSTLFPHWFVIALKPFIYLFYKIKFRRDIESGRSRIHTLSRMFQKSSLKWMRKIEAFMPDYEMKKESVDKIKSPVVIVGAQDDPEHDTESIKKMINFIPGSKYRLVPSKDDTHNETFGKIILEEMRNLTK
jgi:hypothetical protein